MMCDDKKIKFIEVPIDKEVDYTKCEKLTSLIKRVVEKRKELGIKSGGMSIVDFQIRVQNEMLKESDSPKIWYKYRKFRNYLVHKHIADRIFDKLTRDK